MGEIWWRCNEVRLRNCSRLHFPLEEDTPRSRTTLLDGIQCGRRDRRYRSAIRVYHEPLILAQLLSRSPPNLRSDIERRIAALAPIDAGAIHSLPEMQARIDELLTAGAADAAASYMAAEVGLTTWGKPAGRELARFQNQLRLHFLRKDWAAIAATADPNFPAPLEQAAAVETLRQFRGLAALKGPNPNPEGAKTLFADLFAKRPSLSFATNWFAAEISELLQTDSFGLLKGDQIRKGQKAIAEVERMTALLPAASVDEAMECNRALLLLALGEAKSGPRRPVDRDLGSPAGYRRSLSRHSAGQAGPAIGGDRGAGCR